MAVDRPALEALGREQLIREARRYGVQRPEVMTRVELVDEVLRLGTPNPVERKRVRGWLGVARDLVADIVEQGLNLPDAAALIRGDVKFEPLKPVHPPMATVTLAEIYGAQGHFQKALAILDDVLSKEPDHEAARRLRNRIERDRLAGKGARAASTAVSPEDPEPVTLGRQNAEPAAVEEDRPTKPSISSDDDSEPLTPRRLSKRPPPVAEEGAVAVLAFAEGNAESAELPAPSGDELEPLTPRRLSKQPPPLATEPGSEGPPASDSVSVAEPVELYDDGAVLVRTVPSRAVVYFELRTERVNGDPLTVHVGEWRPGAFGAVRVDREFAATGVRGTVFVDGLAPDSVVRAAIGRKRHGRFQAISVAVEAAPSPSGPDVVWAPRPRKDYAETVRRARSMITAT